MERNETGKIATVSAVVGVIGAGVGRAITTFIATGLPETVAPAALEQRGIMSLVCGVGSAALGAVLEYTSQRG